MLAEVRDIIREVRTSSNLDEALAVIVRRIKSFLPVDASAVYLTDVDTDEYVLMASSGLRSASIGRVRADRHAGLLGLFGERRELVVLTNATAHPRYRPSPETAEEHYDTFLGIPLIHYHHADPNFHGQAGTGARRGGTRGRRWAVRSPAAECRARGGRDLRARQ